MILKKIILLSFVLIFIIFNSETKAKVLVKYKVNEEIITNIDIENEEDYLISLNNQLQNLDKKKIKEIAINSIIKEKVKKIELLKYYELNQKSPRLDEIIKNMYLKLGLSNEIEFIEYLKKFNMTIKKIKKKIEIETTWNKLIYDKYNKQIYVDVEALKKNIDLNKTTEDKKEYQLSEIVFKKNNDETINERILKIKKSINEIGFKNTANTFSITDSAKFGGNIGWIDETILSNRIRNSLKKLEIGNLTKPISIGKNFLILKLEDIKYVTKKIDPKIEIEKNIRFEQNRQLELFSKIYFDKVKINAFISEL
jgi:peptidyl-prolyl cis-trans isomerase SurA